MNLREIIEIGKEYKISQEEIMISEEKRLSFIKKFPVEKIKEMKLEEYALQKDNFPDKYQETMIYYLERKNILAGIGGGNSSKFYIYMDKEGNYCKGYSGKKKILKGEELEEEFTKLKESIYKVITLAREDKIEEISKLNIPIWNMVLLKLLVIYVPEKFLDVLSSSCIVPLAKDIGLDEKYDINSDNIILLNYQANKILKKEEVFKDWNYERLGKLIYTIYNTEKNTANYWAIGSTYEEEGSMLESFIKNNVVGIGYFRKDISDYLDDKEELKKFIDSKKDSKSKQPITTFTKIKKGDLIALKTSYTKGPRTNSISILRVDAIGRVKEDPVDGYVFDEKLGHTLPVEWIDTEERIFENVAYFKAISQVQNKEIINKIFKGKDNKSSKKEIKHEIESRNIIFYGPPGTGKTYNVVNKALEIIDKQYYKDLINNDSKEARINAVEEFNKLMENNQIGFCTFHQSYGYEEFVEGLKSDGNGNFVCQDGILKDISIRAAYAGLSNKDTNKVDINKKKESVINNIRNKEIFNFNGKDKFVLIIDEINRGNISKIFGELLTLLEEDKRITRENQVTCKLTYTKENFSLPPNLYILGTMNTADRSIALLDIALRRRFDFIEMMPDTSMLEPIEDVNLSQMLDIINNRIEYFYDRDHMIGHAYLTNVEKIEDISKVLKNKIIPLLQEYFYDDFEKIGLILGGIGENEDDEFIVYKEEIETENLFRKKFSGDFTNKSKYHIKSEIGIKEIKNIYEM